MSVKLCTKTIEGTKVDIHVRDDGEFYAVGLSGVTVERNFTVLAELLAHLRKTLKRVKRDVAIPATLLDTQESTHFTNHVSTWISGSSFRQITLVSVHAGTGALIAKDDAGRRFTLDRYDARRSLTRRLTPEQAVGYRRLRDAEEAASEAVRAFLKEWEIPDPVKAVQEAQRQAEVGGGTR